MACAAPRAARFLALALLAGGTLAARGSSDLHAVRKKRRVTADVSLDGCPDHVHWEDATVRNELDPATPSIVYWLRSLFTPAESARLVRLLEHASFGTQADSTDDAPAYEIYLNEEQATEKDQQLVTVARNFVASRFAQCVAPFVRKKFGCAACVPCAKLVQRYRRDERTEMVAHRDLVSSVTVVVELQRAQQQPAGGAETFGGGLFIKSGEDDPQTNFVPMRPGDGFLHNYELLHGVKISCDDCSRYSLIVWFQESEAKCLAGGPVEAAEQMFRRSAEAGVSEGRFSYARRVLPFVIDESGNMEHLVRGGGSETGDADATDAERARRVGGEAVAFLRAAATEQSHARSALMLAQLHATGVPLLLQPDLTEAKRWRRSALALGTDELVAAWDAQFGALLNATAEADVERPWAGVTVLARTSLALALGALAALVAFRQREAGTRGGAAARSSGGGGGAGKQEHPASKQAGSKKSKKK